MAEKSKRLHCAALRVRSCKRTRRPNWRHCAIGHNPSARPGSAYANTKGPPGCAGGRPSKEHALLQFATRLASIGCRINGRPARLGDWSNNCGDRDDDPDPRRRGRRREAQCGRPLRTRPSGCPTLNTKTQAPARRRRGPSQLWPTSCRRRARLESRHSSEMKT